MLHLFCDWLISLSLISFSFIHVVAEAGFPLFLLLNNIPLCIYIPHILYFSMNGQFGCFHVLAIINNAAMNMDV